MAEYTTASYNLGFQKDQGGATGQQSSRIRTRHIRGNAELDAKVFALIAKLR